MYYEIEKNGKKFKVEPKNLTIEDFLYSFQIILEEYFQSKKNFFEYLQEKIKDPYLNNVLQECEFKYSEEKNILEDKEGSYNIDFIAEVDNNLLFISGYYIWIEREENGQIKKYFYYTD